MSITIYSVVPKRLIEDAKRIEKHAEDQLEAWIALGQSDKYAKAVDQARILRLAANGKDVYSRRAFLKIAGFTVKNLDKTLKENPTMKPASPAQLAARKRFAEMARSGAFKKATKRKANPAIPMANSDFAMITEIKLFAENDYDLYRQQGKPIIDNLAKKMAKGQFDPAKAVKLYGYLADSAVKKYSVEQMGKRTPTLTILNKNDRELLAQQLFEAYAEEIADTAKQYAPKRKTNPAKKTVSQKVSQLVHEGYPQRQAVAVALSEQRAGKVKRNPSKVKHVIEYKGHKDFTGYAVREPGSEKYIAVFASRKQAVALAQNQADYHNKTMEVAKIQLVRTK